MVAKDNEAIMYVRIETEVGNFKYNHEDVPCGLVR